VTLRGPTTVKDVAIRGGSYAAVNLEGGLLVTRASSNPEYERRTLLDLDTQASIPPDSLITSATLTLTVHWGGVTQLRDVAVYPVITAFVASQATWNTATASTPWLKPGGDFGSRNSKTAVPNTDGSRATFEVTQLVQAAVRSTASRRTLIALVDAGSLDDGKSGYREYYSTEAADPSLRPTLSVTYTVGTPPPTTLPNFSHVFTIVMENREYSSIIGSPSSPYINMLANQYGLATNFTGVTHPSLPNYMALTGGQPVFNSNCVGCTTPARNIVDQVADSGRQWKAYMESMPVACGMSDTSLYVQKHNPFVHYDDIVNNPTRCRTHVVPFSAFAADLAANNLADYVWITPNLCHDMHDCTRATGDAWLSEIVPPILNSPSFANSVLLILWDEGTTNTGGGGRVPALVISPFTRAGTRSGAPTNHYNVLRTIEDAWRLPPLGRAADAQPLTEFFQP
jgi:acid phosphatase